MPQESQQPKNDDVRSFLSGRVLETAPHVEEIKRKREILAKVRAQRDATLFNRGKVEGDPDKEYRWVNIHPERQLVFQIQGWRMVTADDVDVVTNYKQADGTHRRGDLVLYCIDKEWAEMIHFDAVVQGIERIEGAKSSFETQAQKDGVPTFRPQV